MRKTCIRVRRVRARARGSAVQLKARHQDLHNGHGYRAVTPKIAYHSTEEEALDLANGTSFGLAAAVFTSGAKPTCARVYVFSVHVYFSKRLPGASIVYVAGSA